MIWVDPDYILTLIGKPWKTQPEFSLKSLFSRSSHRPFYWKTHPILFSKFQFWDVTQTVLLENPSSQKIRRLRDAPEFVNYYFWLNAFFWMSFPVKRSSSRPGFLKHWIKLMIFLWMSFPVKRSQKFPRNLPIRVYLE